MTAIVWLRRELRLRDNPALDAAIRSGLPVAPVFCFDDALLRGRHASPARTAFLLGCLAELDRDLRDRGAALLVRRGNPAHELSLLASELRATELHLTRDVGPFARRRQREVSEAMAHAGVRVHDHPGLFAVDSLSAIRTGAGAPYTVFTPFFRRWLACPRRRPIPAPRALRGGLPLNARRGELPTLAQLGLPEADVRGTPAGEAAAQAALRRFLSGPVARYAAERDLPSADGASRLSPYLHLGCLSVRELEVRLPEGDGAAAFRRQLCWRDFYAHVLGHFPADARIEHQPRMRALSWRDDAAALDAWRAGVTGHPLVDAAMRQLRQEGWMHNRARLVVGSFLTKDLGIDWREGERWFMRLLVDGDEASNNGNWQWVASVGVDPQPPARRIFSPERQLRRFDPDGTYTRRYVPELEGVPLAYLPAPWTMPADVQRRAGCRIGRDYPAPIVDHALARAEALRRYRCAAGPG